MVLRTRGGRKVRSQAALDKMSDANYINILASYIDVDSELIDRLKRAKNQKDIIDAIRDSTRRGMNITSPLEHYAETTQLLKERLLEIAGVGKVAKPGVKVPREPIAEVKMPGKIKVTREGKTTYRFKSIPWKEKRGQKAMSAQEHFILNRADVPIKELQSKFIEHFKIYRSSSGIYVKLRRLKLREARK